MCYKNGNRHFVFKLSRLIMCCSEIASNAEKVHQTGTHHLIPAQCRFINDNAIVDFNRVIKDRMVIYVSGFVGVKPVGSALRCCHIIRVCLPWRMQDCQVILSVILIRSQDKFHTMDKVIFT